MAGALALPGLPRAIEQVPSPSPSPSPRPPDLANLHELMAWLGRENAPRLSFLDAKWKGLEDWKREARPVYQAHLRYEPKARPLGADVVAKEEREGFTLETVRIHATEAYDIPARVLLPAPRRGRRPGLVALHCHSGQYVWGHEKILSSPRDGEALVAFRERSYGRPYAERLAQKGYVVV